MHAQFESIEEFRGGGGGARSGEQRDNGYARRGRQKNGMQHGTSDGSSVCVDVLMELETAREDDGRSALATPPNGGAWALF